jgi:sugar phosphate isomerase/epimerase
MSTLKLGVICSLSGGARKAFEKAASLGLEGVQLACWEPRLYTDEAIDETLAAADEFNIEINTVWAGAPGKTVWNFTEGPLTIGIVPRDNREERIAGLTAGADFAKRIGVKSITTHVGFIPEDPNRDLYIEAVDNLKHVAGYCRDMGMGFWFETGQETPTTLLRTIEDMGLDNVGINLDPANLVMYGKANPVDALDVFGKYVRGVHAKDGVYPTTGRALGKEVPLGEGKVDFPTLIGRLRNEFGFTGHLTIEREIFGDQQVADIQRAIALLKPLVA